MSKRGFSAIALSFVASMLAGPALALDMKEPGDVLTVTTVCDKQEAIRMIITAHHDATARGEGFTDEAKAAVNAAIDAGLASNECVWLRGGVEMTLVAPVGELIAVDFGSGLEPAQVWTATAEGDATLFYIGVRSINRPKGVAA